MPDNDTVAVETPATPAPVRRKNRKRHKKIRKILIILLILAAVALYLFFKNGKTGAAAGNANDTLSVYTVSRRNITEILTGTAAKLNTFQVVRSGEGREVERYPGYHFEDLAFRYQNKIMQPLEVTINPSDEPAKLVQHTGQEFNLVLEGTLVVVWGDREFTLNPGDSIYFNPTIPHGQRCGGEVPARFVTVIAE